MVSFPGDEKPVSTRSKQPDFERLQWAFPLVVTLHNLEEAIWLPSWAARHSSLIAWQVSTIGFRMGLAVVTLAAYVVTWSSVSRGRESAWTYLFVAYTWAMLLNVFVPHVPATILFKSYTPGVVTAVLLNLPVTAMLLARVLRERIIPSLAIAALVFGLPLGIAVVAAVFFVAGLRL